MQKAHLVLKVGFGHQRDGVAALLANGTYISLPRSRIPNFPSGPPPSDLALSEDGQSIIFDQDKVLISVLDYLDLAIGFAAAKIQGRRGGRRKSPAAATSSRRNGQRGGRPSKSK
jgi:hypothetical protein|tara:strand:+ start:952 stop:1296 length:345 start_codon:yes stop_codon:yes gene_type:complete